MITFKPLEESNIENIIKMMQVFYAIDNYPIDIEVSKKLFAEFIETENLGKAYLIYIDETIVGYFILTFVFSFEYKGRLAFLDELYICEKVRRQGIGKQTIAFIKSLANELSIKMMYLEVENHNIIAQNLYLKNDFDFHNRKIMNWKP